MGSTSASSGVQSSISDGVTKYFVGQLFSHGSSAKPVTFSMSFGSMRPPQTSCAGG